MKDGRIAYRIAAYIGFCVILFVGYLFKKKMSLGVVDYVMLGELIGFTVLVLVLWFAGGGFRTKERK